MTWLWWAVPLVVADFLWTLNEFLQGRLKGAISGFLALLIFVLIGIAFITSGWMIGAGALIGSFALSNFLRPLALAVARRLTPYPDLGIEEYNEREYQRMMANFGSEDYFNHRESEKTMEAIHATEAVASAMQTPAVAEVLSQLGGEEKDLAALYDRIEVHSLPPHLRVTVLRNAALVRFFLENSDPYEVYDGSYARKVSEDTAMRLQLWTHHNPEGEEPTP